MAEGDQGTWWNWIQSAKDQVVAQSAEVYDLVKKDINEVTKVVAEEASSMVSSTATAIKKNLSLDDETSPANNMKKSVSGFLNHVSEVFTPPPDDEDEEAFMIRNQQPVFLDRLQAAVYAIQQDPATFLLDPEGEEKLFEEWRTSFQLEENQNKLTQLLVECEKLRENYTKLVPSDVTHVVFWHRYFYKVEVLETAHAKRQEIKKRAQETNVDGVIGWDEEEEFGGKDDIPETIQQQLLEDYEQECKTTDGKSKTKTDTEKEEITTAPETIEEKTKPTTDTNAPNVNKSDKSGRVTPSGVEVLCNSSTPSEVESNEEDWEKVNDADTELPTTKVSPSKTSSSGKSDDWENWE